MSMLEPETIPDGALPVAELAAQMRLPDGWDTVPGQAARLRGRLRAAIAEVEAKLAKVLILRGVSGRVAAGRHGRVMVPLAPVREVTDVLHERGVELLEVGGLEPEAHRATIRLAEPIREGTPLRLTIRAGYGEWADIPEGLAQAVLLLAEAADLGESPADIARVAALLAPMRPVRMGAGR